MKLCWVVAWVALATAPAPAVAQVRTVELIAPRPFGYFLGDTIGHEVDIVLDRPFVLDPASLPSPGPRDYWLDLQAARLDDADTAGDVRRYRLRLIYQTFYAPLEPRAMVIPAVELSAVGGGRRVPVNVSAWTFLMSPLRELARGGSTALRSDEKPRAIRSGAMMRVVIGAGLTALLATAVLARRRAWWPFGARQARPFTTAAQTIRRELRGGANTAAYHKALLELHRAFDRAAGHRLLAEDVDPFLSGAAQYRDLTTPIHGFFEASRATFFGTREAAARELLPPPKLVRLATGLARAERRGG